MTSIELDSLRPGPVRSEISLRRGTRAAGLLLFLAALICSGDALAQCIVGSPPTVFDQPGLFIPGSAAIGGPQDNSIALYRSSAGYRVVTRYDYGYVVFDAAVPERPTLLNSFDIHSSNYPKYVIVGDGQYSVNAVGAAADGSRLLVSYNGSGHGTILLPGIGSTGTFTTIGGDFLPSYCRTCGGGPAVDIVGSRYIGYASNPYGIYVADVTTALTGAKATAVGKIPSEVIAGAPTGPGTKTPTLAVTADGTRRYLVYGTGVSGTDPVSHVVVVDVSSPGAAVPGITSNFRTTVFNASDFGLPGAIIYAIGAAIHPVTQKLQILVEGVNASGSGVVLATFNPGATPTLTLSPAFTPRAVGRWSPDSSSATVAMLLPTAAKDDLLGFVWKQGTSGASKLFSFSSNSWGTDFSPSVILDPAVTAHWATPQEMRGFASGTSVYAYVGTPTSQGSYAHAMRLDCVLNTGPATANITAVNASAGNAALADGASVFVGDTVTLTPSIYPVPDAEFPSTLLTGWNMDLDYHPSSPSERSPGSGFPQIKQPDFSLGTRNNVPGAGTFGFSAVPPSSITLVGPCDPRAANYSTDGGQCWNSVVGNSSTGGPDFTLPVAEGQSTTLYYALEAQNGNTSALGGSAGVRTFGINWTVPRVLVKDSPAGAGAQNLGILTGGTVYDASEGHPYWRGANPYRWYFEDAVGAGTYSLDPACAAASCTHDFTKGGTVNGKGTFGYWLTVPYANGYVSEECAATAAPCTRKRGNITVNDVVTAFTVPQSVVKTSTTVPVTNQTTKGAGVLDCPSTSTAYVYALCQEAAAGVPCNVVDGDYFNTITFANGNGSFTTPVPAAYPGKYWLRIRYRYTTGASCPATAALATVSQWTPGVPGVSDPTAWPLTVTDLPPVIGLQTSTGTEINCDQFFNGCPTVGQQIRAVAIDTITGSVIQDGTVPRWTFDSSANPSSATGSPSALFSYSTQGDKVIRLDGYGAQLSYTIHVVPAPAGCGSGPATPTVTLTAGANPSCPGAPITLDAGGGYTTYLWSTGATTRTITVSPTVTSSYAVTGTVSGCTSAAGNWMQTVNAAPSTPVASSDSPKCQGGTLHLSVGSVPGATYAWSGPNGFTSTQQNPTIANATPAVAGAYEVAVTVAGCTSAPGSTTVAVSPSPAVTGVLPADGSAGFTGRSVSWTATAATAYDVYFDTVSPPQKLLLAGTASTNAALPVTFANTTYFWQVVPKASCGSGTSAVSSFTTGTCTFTGAPPTLSAPPDAATGQPIAAILGWNALAGTAHYDVYLGTTNPPTIRYAAVPTPATSLPVRLAPGKTYYWQVKAVPGCGNDTATASAVWSFATGTNGFTLASSTPSFLNRWTGGPLSVSGSGFLGTTTAFTDLNGTSAGAFSPGSSTAAQISGTVAAGSSPAGYYDVGITDSGNDVGRLAKALVLRAFTDVNETQFFFESASRVSDAGIMEADFDPGTGGPQFAPTTVVTRALMAEYMAKSYEWLRTRTTALPAATCTPDGSGGSTDFPDVPCTHPDWLAIHWIRAWGITAGAACPPPYSGLCYLPDTGITRGQMATFLSRLKYGAEGTGTVLQGFLNAQGTLDPGCQAAYPACSGWTDSELQNAPSAWPHNYVNVAYQDRLTNGCSGSTPPLGFCPGTLMTRGQMAEFLGRAVGLVPTP